MSDNHYAPARVADNAGRAQIIHNRFSTPMVDTPGVSNAWSAAYRELLAATAADWVVLGAYVKIIALAAATANIDLRAQVATGAAGSEVPFFSFGDACGFLLPAATGSYVAWSRTFLCPPTFVPSGTRLSYHSTVNAATTLGRIVIYLFGVPSPFYQRPHPNHRVEGYMRGRTALAPSQAQSDFMLLPTPLTFASATSGIGAFGNWATVIAAASQTSPLLVVGLKVIENVAGHFLNQSIHAEVGIGEAASAVGFEEVGWPNSGGLGMPGGCLQLRRPVFVPAGSGLSVRCGSGVTKVALFQIIAVPLR